VADALSTKVSFVCRVLANDARFVSALRMVLDGESIGVVRRRCGEVSRQWVSVIRRSVRLAGEEFVREMLSFVEPMVRDGRCVLCGAELPESPKARAWHFRAKHLDTVLGIIISIERRLSRSA